MNQVEPSQEQVDQTTQEIVSSTNHDSSYLSILSHNPMFGAGFGLFGLAAFGMAGMRVRRSLPHSFTLSSLLE